MQINHLSYTSMSCFERCPKQFEFSRTTKAPSTGAMEAGTGIHAKLAADLKAGAAKPSVGGRKLEAFFKYALPSATGIEEKIEIDLMGQKYIGFIDAYLDRGEVVRIVDWKSYKGSMVNEKQLKMYALGLLDKFPNAKVFECYFFYVGSDSYDKYEFFRDDIESFERELYDLTMKITATKEFAPAPGSHCSYCQYTTDCPAAKNLKIVECATLEQATEMATKLFAVSALCEQAEKLLKTFMIENGLEEILVGPSDHYYLSTSAPSLKKGKVAAEKKPRKTTEERIAKIKKTTEKNKEEENNA